MSDITNQATANAVNAYIAELQQTTRDTTAVIEQGRADVIAIVSAASPIAFFKDHADAVSKIATVPVDGIFEINKDETQEDCRTRYYKRAGNVLEFAVNLDQTRQDLQSEGGAEIVRFGSVTVGDKLRESVSILEKGGSNTGDDNSAALSALAAQGVEMVHFPAGGSNEYVFGVGTAVAASAGMTWDVAPGVAITVADTGYLSPDLRVVRPTRVRLSALNCDYWLTPQRDHSSVCSAFAVSPLAYSDADFSEIAPIAPNGGDLAFRYIPWSASDVFTDFVPYGASVSGMQLDFQLQGVFYLGMRTLKPGDELTTRMDVISGSAQIIVAMVRTTAGIHGIYSPIGAAARPDFFEKLKGQAATTKPITAAQLGMYQSYDGEFALWSVRVNSPTNFSVLLSGVEVLNYTTPGEILECGLGALATAPSQQAVFQDWTLTRRKIDGGKKALNIAIFGDSRADESKMPDVWPQWLRRYLDGWHGMRVHRIDNYAIAGQTTAQQAALCTPENIAAADIVLIDPGVNDIQARTSENTYYNVLKGMLTTCQTAGKPVILGVPDQFYGRGQVGAGVGQDTKYYGEGKYIRSKCLRLAADTSTKIVDKQQVLGPIIAHYINPALVPNLADLKLDPVVYDNIHFTAFGHQLIGAAYARAIAGLVTQDRTLSLVKSPVALSLAGLQNGWTATLQPPKWWRSADGVVSLGGLLQAGAKANGTAIYTLPENARPVDTVRVPVVTDQNTVALLNIDSTGVMSVYGLGIGNWLSLDGICYPTKLS